MAKEKLTGTQEVNQFLAELEHPFKPEIEQLRKIILGANKELYENIKWNAPNFGLKGEDRITMRIHPPKQIQLIFHRGAKVQNLPPKNLITDDKGLLAWKTTDRAVATFANLKEIKSAAGDITDLVTKWLKAT